MKNKTAVDKEKLYDIVYDSKVLTGLATIGRIMCRFPRLDDPDVSEKEWREVMDKVDDWYKKINSRVNKQL